MNKKTTIFLIILAIVVIGLIVYFSFRKGTSNQVQTSNAVDRVISSINKNSGKKEPLQDIAGQITKDGQKVNGKAIVGDKTADVVDGSFTVEGLAVPDIYNVQFIDRDGFSYVLDPPSVNLWSGGNYSFTVKY